MNRLLAASAALPTWTRWAGWLATAAAVFVATSAPRPPWTWLAVALAAFTAFAHLPALAFDGPLPFSHEGLHLRGQVFRWDEVARIEPAEAGRDLQAIIVRGDDEAAVPIRVRGARTRDQLRSALTAHAPDKVAF